ncbi:MAG TPA: helix-turn-helix transcriptional regulator [Candidatus Acidoferrales bacterium]|nr:helix-turn-helix transcriptional regulator [Candidatus Acidoferrales bacterium]
MRARSLGVYETGHRAEGTLHYHRHDLPYAAIVTAGSYVEVVDAVPKRCSAGSLVVHGPGEEHADHFSAPTRCLNVELPPTVEVPPHGVVADRLLTIAMRGVVRAYDDRDRGRLTAWIARLSRLIARPAPAGPAAPAWLDAVLGSFEWTGDAPLRDAARLAGVHPVHFSREFRRRVGMTPHAFRRRARVELASKLLLRGDVPLAQVALRCGFGDQSHFNRGFAQTLGVAPGRYRRAFAR